jgi:hypothetical protein
MKSPMENFKTQGLEPIVENYPSLMFCFDLSLYYTVEYLIEFETKFKNILEYESGVQMGFLDEKTEVENLTLLSFKCMYMFA